MNTKKIDDGGHAFPINAPESYGGPVAGMTLRQFAAITLRVPNSGTPWLDEMILERMRDDFAGQALAGEFAAQNEYAGAFPTNNPQEDLVGRAELMYRMADAMIAARKGGA